MWSSLVAASPVPGFFTSVSVLDLKVVLLEADDFRFGDILTFLETCAWGDALFKKRAGPGHA